MAARPRPPVPLPEARWPSAEEAAASLLFSPLAIGPLQAEERTWVPAMVPWRAQEDGTVTAENLDWYGRFAAGRPGVLVAEATGIRDIPSGPLLRIGHDRFVPGLRALTERVRTESAGRTRFLIQIIDFLSVRRRPEPARFFGRYWTPTEAHRARLAAALDTDRWLTAPEADVRTVLESGGEALHEAVLLPRELRDLRFGYREDVNDVHLPHIEELPRTLPGLFADAAVRAREAGFDGVELHYAHAYTMASFLSRTNQRSDGYGGSPEGRVRLPLEILAAVRAAVGKDWCVGLRFLGDEVIEGGSRIEDAVYYAERFAEAGVDFLSVSKGGKFDDAKQPRIGHAVYPYTGPSGHECMPTVRIDEAGPFARNVPLARTIRSALHAQGHALPIVTAGGLCTFDQAEGILQRGEADIIGSARQTLADPDWFRKMRLGQGAHVRRCVFTNYCEGLDQMHKQVTCKLWDKDFPKPPAPADPAIALSEDGRRRLVAPAWSSSPLSAGE
jgi:2,4-dienoyl-CoA reductase-like NADH-dependent reductase (Old Yellow Enzyme family)